ncbi:MAG: DJ-1/PfpI family protein [Candidatus Heimdallarchaeota archaeon]|nr:MAG: DJ-1/PfpI family protein [Candidatus Heimdallarchaeota archaeon]
MRKNLRILIALCLFSSFNIISQGYFQISFTWTETMEGVEVIAFIADDFDRGELNFIQNYLESYGCNVTIAGINRTVSGVSTDILISNVNITRYDCILIPGGGSPANLVEHEEVLEIIRTAYSEGILLAAICHGPLVLAEAGVIDGKNVTGYQGIRADLESAGGNYVSESVVIDGSIITANAPFFQEISLAIATVLGYYETDPPTIKNCSYEVLSVNEVITYNVTVETTDETGIYMITAFIYEVSENKERLYPYFTTFGILDDENEDGIYKRSFILDKGYYCVDIATVDVFGNEETYSNALYITRLIGSLTTSENNSSVTKTTETRETSTIFPELIIIWISLISLVFHTRKRRGV